MSTDLNTDTSTSIDVSWGGPSFPSYAGYMAAGAGTGAPSSPGGGTPAPSPSPSPSPAPSPAPSSPGPGSGSGSGTVTDPGSSSGQSGAPGVPPSPSSSGPGNDQNITRLRETHDLVTRLGGQEKVQAAVQRYEHVRTQAADLAKQLGYTPDSFEEAFAESPVEIYNHLMQEARTVSNQRTQGDPALRDTLNRELAPIRQVLTRQLATEANNRVNSEFGSMITAHDIFKGKDVPADVKDYIYNSFTDRVKMDDAVQNQVLEGKTAGLKPHFDAAVAAFVKAQNAWSKFTGAPVPGAGTGTGTGAGDRGRSRESTPGAGTNPFSLDDVIEGNDNATKGIASLRNFAS